MRIEIYREVVVTELAPDAFLVRCGSCAGKGRYLRDTSYACGVCAGTGTVKMILGDRDDRSQPWGLLRCGSCAGKGRYLLDTSYACKLCDGRGVTWGCFPRVTCGSCQGSGRYLNDKSYACKICNGRGSVWVEKLR